VFWLFVDLQKPHDTVVRGASWWSLGNEGGSTEFVEGVKNMHKDVRIGAKCRGSFILVC
jgi:hypothetical protein